MFNPANQPHFSLQLPVAHDLQVLEFRGREALSTPFAFEVESGPLGRGPEICQHLTQQGASKSFHTLRKL